MCHTLREDTLFEISEIAIEERLATLLQFASIVQVTDEQAAS